MNLIMTAARQPAIAMSLRDVKAAVLQDQLELAIITALITRWPVQRELLGRTLSDLWGIFNERYFSTAFSVRFTNDAVVLDCTVECIDRNEEPDTHIYRAVVVVAPIVTNSNALALLRSYEIWRGKFSLPPVEDRVEAVGNVIVAGKIGSGIAKDSLVKLFGAAGVKLVEFESIDVAVPENLRNPHNRMRRRRRIAAPAQEVQGVVDEAGSPESETPHSP